MALGYSSKPSKEKIDEMLPPSLVSTEGPRSQSTAEQMVKEETRRRVQVVCVKRMEAIRWRRGKIGDGGKKRGRMT
jgi:hypothetical protein